MATDLIVGTGAIVAVIVYGFIAELKAIDAMRPKANQSMKTSVAPKKRPATPERAG